MKSTASFDPACDALQGRGAALASGGVAAPRARTRTPGDTIPEGTPGGPGARARKLRALAHMGCLDPPAQDSARLIWLDHTDYVQIGAGDEFAVEPGTEGWLEVCVADPRVSWRHAVLERRGQQWRIRDAGAKNGTRVGGKRVDACLLRHGDVVETGRTFWRYLEYTPRLPALFPDDPAVDFGPTRTICPALIEALAVLGRAATGSMHVLILGETGTGKEVLADQVHAWSGRTGACHKVNCAAIAEPVAGWLFGWARGAFTGADRDQEGHVEAAHGGTLVLDEIGELPFDIQAKLLRVAENGELYRLGDTRRRLVDVRIVAATHRDIPAMVHEKTFREDLYGRLARQITRIPSLRERLEDLPTLAAHFLARQEGAARRLHPRAMRRLLGYEWPQNVRELGTAIEQAVRLAGDSEVLLAEHFTVGPEPAPDVADPPKAPAPRPVDAELRTRLHELFCEHRGNVQVVADAMQVGRKQVYRWVERLGLDLGSYR
jgi:sigma-54 interacting transcriptional regulator/FHA domain-containing protein